MPTPRLTDENKRDIARKFYYVLRRASWNKPFPVTEKDDPKLKNLGLLCIEEQARIHYEALLKLDESLLKPSAWKTEMSISDDDFVYYLEGRDMDIIKQNLRIPIEYPHHDAILEWAQFNSCVEQDVKTAGEIIGKVIDSCSTVGQIKRVLPEDLLRYVPDVLTMQLGEAERASRIPRHLDIDKEKIEHLGNMLALASISPKEQPESMGVSFLYARHKE